MGSKVTRARFLVRSDVLSNLDRMEVKHDHEDALPACAESNLERIPLVVTRGLAPTVEDGCVR